MTTHKDLPTDTAIKTVLHNMHTPFKMSVANPDGKVMHETTVAEEAAKKIKGILERESPKNAKRVLEKIRRSSEASNLDELFPGALPETKDVAKEAFRIINVEQEMAEVELALSIITELQCWNEVNGGAVMQKPHSSRAHALTEAIRGGRAIKMRVDASGIARAWLIQAASENIGEVFVVEHDWAAAFKGAHDFDDVQNKIRLPYPVMCFEFALSGKRICVLAASSHDEGFDVLLAPVVELRTSVPGAWLMLEPCPLWDPILNWLQLQVRAICIALEAEVAETDVIRAPYRLNRARERRGKLPAYDHHIIKLAHRSRAASLPPQDGEREPGTKKRLHFRRGHFRHYENHKVWIKWMLVGDPDLGFIDKQYRM